MMVPAIHFIAGMPRAGSTLLCNILNQNPRFNATSTSGILDILVAIRNQWSNVDSFKATPNQRGKRLVLKGILESYYSESPAPVAFDKSRGWLQYLEMAELILGRKAKVLVPVRDIRDIVSSFETIYREHAGMDPIPQEKADPTGWQTLEGRVTGWMSPGSPVGSAHNRINDAISRGFRDRMHFVHFEQLTRSPDRVMADIYGFLDEPVFPHDFDHVKQVTTEDDTQYGFPQGSLHQIRQKVAPVAPRWPQVLGQALGDRLVHHNALWSR